MTKTALLIDPRAGRRPAPTGGPRPAQACPGGCGHQVPVELICCRRCWYTLPERMRVAIHSLWRRTPRGRRAAIARTAAIAAARYWFRRQAVTS
jgi:hypothetical protein